MDRKKTNDQLLSLVATFSLTGGSLNRGLEIRLQGQGHCPLQITLCWVPWSRVWQFGPCNVLLMWKTSFIFTTTTLSAPLGSFVKNKIIAATTMVKFLPFDLSYPLGERSVLSLIRGTVAIPLRGIHATPKCWPTTLGKWTKRQGYEFCSSSTAAACDHDLEQVFSPL